MKEVLFRVYDSNRNFVENAVYCNGEWFNSGRSFEDYIKMENPIVCQYSGLTIEGNRKIYEGDIIKGFEINGIHAECIVDFVDGCFVARNMGIGIIRPLSEINCWNIEYVGNIFKETP